MPSVEAIHAQIEGSKPFVRTSLALLPRADLAQVPGRYRETIELVQETDIMLSVTL